jgi:capsular polysaccharide biosynthesis protein
MPTFLPADPRLITHTLPQLERHCGAVATPFAAEGHGFSGALYDRTGDLIAASQRRSGPTEKVYVTDPARIFVTDVEETWTGQGCYIGHVMNHYGHFVTEGLSGFWPAIERDFDYLAAHPFIWGNELPDYARAALRRVSIDPARIRIITRKTRFDDIYIPERLWLMNRSVSVFQRRVVATIKKNFCRPKSFLRIYLSRSQIRRRAVPNEHAIEETFRRAGFAVIQPQNYAFEAQLELYGQARVLAGLAGSALHNVIFCPRGTATISVGDTRTPMTVNQPVCGAFIEGPTAAIEYTPGPNGFDIRTLERELERTLATLPD